MFSHFIYFPTILNQNFTINKVRDKEELKLSLWFCMRKQTKLPNTSYILTPVFLASIHPIKVV